MPMTTEDAKKLFEYAGKLTALVARFFKLSDLANDPKSPRALDSSEVIELKQVDSELRRIVGVS